MKLNTGLSLHASHLNTWLFFLPQSHVLFVFKSQWKTLVNVCPFQMVVLYSSFKNRLNNIDAVQHFSISDFIYLHHLERFSVFSLISTMNLNLNTLFCMVGMSSKLCSFIVSYVCMFVNAFNQLKTKIEFFGTSNS